VTRPLVIFDLDNTLLDRADAFRGWAEDFVARHRLDPAEVEWLVEIDGDGFSSRRGFAAAVRDRYGLAGTAEEFLAGYRDEIIERIRPYGGALAGLAQLRDNGWTLAIATNGETVQQRRKITRNELEPYVDGIVVSQEAGAPKPDARVFELAAQRCGLPLAADHWMVGDCATRDVGGARALGLRTIWLRRGRAWDPAGGPAPDVVADTLTDAVAAILG
jgi:putative hydrolase of the HAD superfamily